MENLYHPLVSVIIPAYNAQAFIDKTLASVLAQTYRNLEILVVDDGSSDRTVEIVQKFAAKDQRIRLLQQPNAGVAAARNLGMKSAQGEFIAPIDADDIWYPENIALQVQVMQQAGAKVGLVYSWSVDIDESGRPTGGFRATEITGEIYTTLVAHNFIGNASATMMRRSCLEQVGGYDPELRAQNAQGCEDWDLYLRIAEHYEFQVVPQFLIGYRKIGNSMSCDYRTMAKSHELVMAAVRRRVPGIPMYLFKLSNSNLYMYFAHQSDRYQQHAITGFWLKKALAAESFTPLIRPGFYRLILSSTWGLLTQKNPDLSPALSSVQQDLNVSDCQSVETTIAPFDPPKLTLSLMIAVGNAFHSLVSTLFQKSAIGPANLQTSLLTEEKR